ncbi:MAG: hypothetical protein MJY76_04805 [Bacteroidales bacterium]|nr:hypothetical protein [Bacteroidales bacterium]
MKKLFLVFLSIVSVIVIVSCQKEQMPVENSDDAASNECIPENAINPNFVMVDWSKATFSLYDAEHNRFEFDYTGEMPEIVPGSVLSIDTGVEGCICKVTSYSVSGNHVVLEGETGDLTDVFMNTTLVLSTNDYDELATKAIGQNRIVAKPVACIVEDEEGNRSEQFISPQTRASKTVHIFNWSFDKSGYKFFDYKNSSGTVSCCAKMAESYVKANLDLYMSIEFKGLSVTPKKMEAYLTGGVSTSQKLVLDAKGNYHKEQKAGVIKNNALSTSIKFVIGVVPIYISVQTDILYDYVIDAKANLHFETGFLASTQTKVGFNWTKDNGIKGISSISNSFNVIYPTITFKGTADAQAWVYPRVRLELYSIIGPSFEIKPYLRAHAEANAECKLNKGNILSASGSWYVAGYMGFDLAAGLSLAGKTWPTPNMNVVEKQLFRIPR